MKNLKAIRFNLQFHVGNEIVPARTLADLNNCMNVDDLFEYFQSGQLERWLKVNGETEKAINIADFKKDEDVATVLSSVFEILKLDFTKDEIAEAIASFVYPREMQKKKLELKSSLDNIHDEISKDFSAYNNLLKDIIKSAEDFGKVKSQVRELLIRYPEQFKLDYIRFYSIMVEKCPLAIFTVLMDKKWRDYYLSTDENKNQLFYGELTDQFKKQDSSTESYASEPQQLSDTERLLEFPENSFSDFIKGETEKFLQITKSYGKLKILINGRDMSDSYIVKKGFIQEAKYENCAGRTYDQFHKGRKFMILHCGTSINVRSHGDSEHEMNGAGARFEILDGLEYALKDNADGSKTESSLFFMEV